MKRISKITIRPGQSIADALGLPRSTLFAQIGIVGYRIEPGRRRVLEVRICC